MQDAATFCFIVFSLKQPQAENFALESFTRVGFSYWRKGIEACDQHVGKNMNSAPQNLTSQIHHRRSMLHPAAIALRLFPTPRLPIPPTTCASSWINSSPTSPFYSAHAMPLPHPSAPVASSSAVRHRLWPSPSSLPFGSDQAALTASITAGEGDRLRLSPATAAA
jgi:hypothetical protein